MDYVFLTGIIGSLILVTGAAWPEAGDEKHPTASVKSVKDWLFAIGGFVMLAYAILGYIQGGSVFFIFLQTLVVIASIMMMLDTPDKVDIPVVTGIGIILIIWSLYLFEGYNTIFFIVGLSGIGLGYTFDMGSLRRSVALTSGAAISGSPRQIP